MYIPKVYELIHTNNANFGISFNFKSFTLLYSVLIELNSNSKILNLGLPDEFVEHGDQEQQKVLNGLDGIGVTKAIEKKLNSI